MPELAFTSAKPTLLTTGGQIWMCSTPHGKQGYFYECFLNKFNRFKVIHVSSEEVIYNRTISESWSERQRTEAIKFLEQEKKDMSELQYGQEYMGLFLDDLRQYFPDELIEKACVLKHDVINRDYPIFLGVDIARLGGDESAFELIQKIKNNKYKHIYNENKKGMLTTQTERRIIELTKQYNITQIGIDAGAGTLGVGILDHLLEEETTRRKTIAINNRSLSLTRDESQKQRLLKEDLYDNLRAMMERGDLKLLNDEAVILSLKSVQFEFKHQQENLSQMRIFGHYTHIVEGLIRAAWLAKKSKSLNFWITSI